MTVKSKGISARSFTGLSKKRMQKKTSVNFGKRLNLNQGETVPVQFLGGPESMEEFDIHVFQEDGRWNYIPCLGDVCPLCDDEDTKKSKVTYRFVANVYNLKEKKAQILEGPKDLASRIFYRYERAPQKFLKRTFEVTKFNTQPVTYDVSIAEEPLVKTTNLEIEDLKKYIDEEARRYYGDDMPTGKTSLDADDDLDDDADDMEDEDVDEDSEVDRDELREELEELNVAQLKKRAKANGAGLAEYKTLDLDDLIDFVLDQEAPLDEDADEDEDDDDDDEDLDTDDEDLDDDDDEDDDDEDEDEDDDDDDEDEPPARSAKRPVKKAAAAAKKAPAKKAAARKAPAKKAAARR